jgi:cellulose synthase operon protein C
VSVLNKGHTESSPRNVSRGDEDKRRNILKEATEAAKDGRFLDAHGILAAQGDFETAFQNYFGADRTEISWIVSELGAPRLARWHVLKAYREAPESLMVRNAYANLISDENGPLDTLDFIAASPSPRPADDQADGGEESLRWLWVQASAYCCLRDFSPAEKFIHCMDAIDTRPDIKHFTRAFWYEKQDRYEEAIVELEQAVAVRESRSNVGYLAHLYTLTGRDERGCELLTDLDRRKQIPSLSWQLTGIAYERRDYDQCRHLLERYESMTPLRERGHGEGFTMFRSELARRAGDDQAAIKFAKRAKSAYGDKIASRLADPQRKQRVDKILPVDFIRQHEMTCGPATLAAICRYWNRPAQHLEVAEEICYNGTTVHAERHWCDTHGFVTRAFSVTEPVTEALIDRDIPFTLVTRGAGYAHLQAVIGYDGRTGTILIRDPYHRVRGAASAEELIEAQESHGPRGLVLIPSELASKLEGIEFPDHELHDAMHAMDGALKIHDRLKAVEILGDLKKRFPDHRLTWQAVRQMAMYDNDEREMAVAIEKLLEMYPDDTSAKMSYVSILANLNRDARRIELLRKWVAEPTPHPLLKLQLAQLLMADGRTRDEAQKLLRQAMQRAPSYARIYLELGDLLWTRNHRVEATRMYRFAACLEEKDEFNATRYFDASVAIGKTEEAADWLRSRFERFGHQSSQPALTLQSAMARLRRYDEGVEVLETALAKRPDDVELAINVAVALAETSGQYIPRSESILESIKDRSPTRAWNQAGSRLAMMQCDFVKARSLLQSELDRTPLAMDLREQISNLIYELEGEDASIDFWRRAAEEHSHYHPIVERYAISLRGRPIEQTSPVLEQILNNNPDDAWAVRELAQHYLSAGNLQRASEWIDRAESLDGEVSFVKLLRASLAEKRGQMPKAREYLRSILEKDIDDEYGVSRLIGACENAELARIELAWVLQQLKRQTVNSGVLSAWRVNATALLPAETVLQSLREAVSARPDLWSAHQALINQLSHMNQLDEAIEKSDGACQQFPLEPNAWYERYQLAVVSGDIETQRQSLDRCRLLRPSNPIVIRALSELLSTQGKYKEASELLEKLVSQQPFDPVSRGYLGDVYAELGEKPKALEQFVAAIRLDPDYEYGWNRGESVAQTLDQSDWRAKMASELVQSKPHSIAAWLEHATAQAIAEDFEAAFATLKKAETINPFNEQVHTIRARLFMNAGDFSNAMAALSPPVYATIPESLQHTQAQLLWDVGQQDAAYQILLTACEEHPESSAVWRRLETWASLRNDRPRLLNSLQKQIELTPHDPDVLDSVGGRYAELGETEKAIDAYSRAVEIAPTYTGSRCQWFDLLIDKGRWHEAAVIIKQLPRLDSHPIVLARRMKVSMHQKDIDGAKKDFDALLMSEDYSSWAADTGIDLLDKAGMSQYVNERIEQGLQAESGSDDFGRLWTLRQFRPGANRRQALLDIAQRAAQLRSGPRPKVAYSVIASTMKILSEPGHEGMLKKFVTSNRTWLESDTHTYVATLFAFADNPQATSHRVMKSWVSQWENRNDYVPWMLTNVHEVWRIVGNDDMASKVVQRAIEMPPDHMHSQLRLWATHDAIGAGDWESALRHFMNAARVENLEGLDRLLHYWAEIVFMVLQSNDRRSSLKSAKAYLKEIALPPNFFQVQPAYRKVYRQAIQSVGKIVNTPQAKMWALWKRLSV